jgi:hypothetical protein
VQKQIGLKNKKNNISRPRRITESIHKVFKSVRNRNQESTANETQASNMSMSKTTWKKSTLRPNVRDLPRSTADEEHYSEEHHDNSPLGMIIEHLDELVAFPVQSITVSDDESVISGITVFYLQME